MLHDADETQRDSTTVGRKSRAATLLRTASGVVRSRNGDAANASKTLSSFGNGPEHSALGPIHALCMHYAFHSGANSVA
jgi:hypothetical protein